MCVCMYVKVTADDQHTTTNKPLTKGGQPIPNNKVASRAQRHQSAVCYANNG